MSYTKNKIPPVIHALYMVNVSVEGVRGLQEKKSRAAMRGKEIQKVIEWHNEIRNEDSSKFFSTISIMAKPRLLLVDDDKTTLDGLVRILTRDEYPVSGVLSGYDALSLLSRKSFDIMITDLNMPGMSGLALIHEIKKRHESMLIVVITACSSLKIVGDILKTASCDYYLIKPVNIEELKVVLKDLWEGRQLTT